MPLSTLIPAAVFTLKAARNLLHDTQIDKSYKKPLLIFQFNSRILTSPIRRSSFIKTPSGHAFNIIEHKTGKIRRFKVQEQVYNFLLEYADSEGIEGDDLIFPIGVRAVQKHLKKICDWLGPGYEDISTHSFRKYFGTEIYYKNGKDIELVRRLYQHSSAAVTARYLGVTDEKIEQALDSHVDIIYRPK
jgi:integrase